MTPARLRPREGDAPGGPGGPGPGAAGPGGADQAGDAPGGSGSNGKHPADEDPFLARRLAMVRDLRTTGPRDPEVLDAMARVPRERFVPPELVRHAYDDCALGIGHGQTISQPYIVARMTELLGLPALRRRDPSRRPRALDVGTGSGYQAAILAELGAEVVSIDRDAALSRLAEERLAALGFDDRVRCVVGDGTEGWPDGAPYDGIVVGAAAPAIPDPLVAQLADNGRLVIPVGPREYQVLTVVTRAGRRIEQHTYDPCVFVPLVGRHGFPG